MSHLLNPLAPAAALWLRRGLLLDLTRRDVVGRYKGSVMGLLWSFFTPILMLAIYTFVFSVVFKARWGEGSDSRVDFAINLFVGMIVHGLFAECVNRAPTLILHNVNYVKKVVFPLEVLPAVSLGGALFHSGISLAVLLVFFAAVHGFVYWTVLLLPLVLLPLALMTLGLAWLLASLGVFLRDIAQITGLFTTVLMFLSPVFYPASALPEPYRMLLYANPLTFIIEQARGVLVAGQPPAWGALALATAAGLLVAVLGYAWFQRTRRGFADVL